MILLACEIFILILHLVVCGGFYFFLKFIGMILNRKFIDKTKKHFWIQCERKTPTNDFLKMERNSGVLALFQPKKNSENILYSTERSTLSQRLLWHLHLWGLTKGRAVKARERMEKDVSQLRSNPQHKVSKAWGLVGSMGSHHLLNIIELAKLRLFLRRSIRMSSKKSLIVYREIFFYVVYSAFIFT